MRIKNLCIVALLIFGSNHFVEAQHQYQINVSSQQSTLRTGHLQMGGSNGFGDSIAVNNRYIEINHEPVFPIVGEIHFSRYPHQYWDEAIKKMKAGGVDVIATYVFWNMHEEIESQFNWEGDNNVREFIELCKANQLRVILRIGPFCHGEIRNGGLPDWLLGKMLTIRSNDPEYLKYVDRLYHQIGQQVKGLLFKDGGPIFAIQLENEFQHSAAPWGLTYPGQPLDFTASERDKNITQEGVGVSNQKNPYADLGNQHMVILKSLAHKNALDVPVYTATGWGNAAIIENQTIPVTAAYPYPGWAPASLSNFYLYTDLQKKPDYSPVRYKGEDYPYFPAEIGGGIMGTYTRRPVIPAQSLEALANRFIGSGACGLGYYMYHGGSTPKGKLFYFNDEAYGYPKISYDFQAPLSEYGKPTESFNRLKIYHNFLNAFGNIVAPMQLVLPENAAIIIPGDVDALRYSMRVKDNSGFLFMNNFQDHQERKDITDIQFKINLDDKVISIPENGSITLAKDESAILPVNLTIAGIHINYATAQLLTSGNDKDGDFVVFFTPEGFEPEFSIAAQNNLNIKANQCQITKDTKRWLVKSTSKNPFEIIINNNGKKVRFLVLDKKSALNSWMFSSEKGARLIISEALPMVESNTVEFVSMGNNLIEFKLYPAGDYSISPERGKLLKLSGKNELFVHYQLELLRKTLDYPVKHLGNKMEIDLSSGLPSGVNDVICRINYKGDTGDGFINGTLVADNFYNGVPWEIGLKRFFEKSDTKSMVIYFRPMKKNAEFIQDLLPQSVPDFSKTNSFLEIGEPEFTPEYKAKISITN